MKLSVQCYTVRDDLARDLWGTLAALQKLGLNYVEIGGTFGLPASELKRGLDELGLKVSANHVGISRLEEDLPAVVAENKVLETPCIVLPSISKERYERGWATVAHDLESIGAKLKDDGFQFAYHNHAFEFKTENGRIGLEILYQSSSPNFLMAQLDTYWVAFGGGNPAQWITRLKGRIPQVHFKDGRLGGDPHFLEVGAGELDWTSILAACKASNVEFASIELDECPRKPMESVRISVEYLRSCGISD